ncbi:HD domain-containing protein [Patescibacteria group bacterium]|nr:HD domain-containing protein [Patescibacteria group bacterium]
MSERKTLEERPNGKKWKELLLAIKSTGSAVDLHGWENYNKTMRDALKEAKRYKKYTRLGANKARPGATFVESVFDHSWNSAFLCDVMLGIEEDEGSAIRFFLDGELLRLAARIHDLPEGLTDDVDIMDKKQSDEAKEDNAFELIIAGLPKATQEIYRRAYALSQEWGEVGAKRDAGMLAKVSKNGRFFAALEILGYLSRGLLETAAGNKVFANIFHNWEKHIEVLRKEFASVRELIDPMEELIDAWKKENPYFVE